MMLGMPASSSTRRVVPAGTVLTTGPTLLLQLAVVLALVAGCALLLRRPLAGLGDADHHHGEAHGDVRDEQGHDALDGAGQLDPDLLLLVREDMGLLVALLGVLRLAQRRRPRWPRS